MSWIKLSRSITEWEWFNDGNTLRLWIYLLTRAQYKDTKYKGMVVRRGQFVASNRRLAEMLELSLNSLRKALNNLVESGAVTTEVLPRSLGTIITVVNFDKYQDDEKEPSESTERETVASPSVSRTVSPTVSSSVSSSVSKNDTPTDTPNMNKNNINNNDKEQNIITVVPTEVEHTQSQLPQVINSNSKTINSRPRFVKPTIDELREYIFEQGYFDVDPQAFYDFYESKNWMVGCNKMHKWKSAVATWHHKASSNNNNSRNYSGGNTYINSETMAILERTYNML